MKFLMSVFTLTLALTAKADPKSSYFVCFNSTGISDAPANILVMAHLSQGMAAGIFNAGNSEPPRAIFSMSVQKAEATTQDPYGPVWKAEAGAVNYDSHVHPGVFPVFTSGTFFFDRTGRPQYEGNLDYLELKSATETITYNNCRESQN